DWRIDLSSVVFESNSHDNGSAEGALTEDGVSHAESQATRRGRDGQAGIKSVCTRSLIEKINMM
ncbi:MAG: hypothetical protein ABIH23_09330, partial [bacterium]